MAPLGRWVCNGARHASHPLANDCSHRDRCSPGRRLDHLSDLRRRAPLSRTHCSRSRSSSGRWEITPEFYEGQSVKMPRAPRLTRRPYDSSGLQFGVRTSSMSEIRRQRGLPQRRHPLAAGEQWRSLGGSDRPSRRDRDGDSGHSDVVRSVHDHRDVVLPRRVAASQYPGSDGIVELLAHDLKGDLGGS